MKIGAKLILSFLIIAFLVFAAGYFFINLSQKILENTIGKQTVFLISDTMKEIDKNIYFKINEFKSLIKFNQEFQIILKSSNEEFFKMADADREKYIDRIDREWIHNLNKDKILELNISLQNNTVAIILKEYIKFQEEREARKVYGEIFVTNKYGVNIAETSKTSDYRQNDEEWWMAAKKEGLYVEDFKYDESSKVNSVSIALRINDSDGEFAGVVKLVVNIEEIFVIIKELEKIQSKWPSAHVKIISKKSKKLVYQTPGFEILEDRLENLLLKINKHESNKYFIAEGDERGLDRELFAYSHSKGFREFSGFPWVIVMEYKADEIFEPVITLKRGLLAVTIAITSLIIGIGLLVSRSITKPISELQIEILSMCKGDKKILKNSKTKNEIQTLLFSFKYMAEQLKKSTISIDGLNKEIFERKKAEEKIKDLEKFPFENPNVVLRIRRDGSILHANPSSRELLKSWKIEIGEPVPDDVCQIIREILIAKQRRKVELKIENSVFSFVFEPFPEDGYVNAYGIDITEHKIMEYDLKEKMKELKKFNNFAIDREIRMEELKEKVNYLVKALADKNKA